MSLRSFPTSHLLFLIVKKHVLYLLLLLCGPAAIAQKTYQPQWSSLDTRPVPAWFSEARFGLFIHWGLYSVPAWATKSGADGFGSGYAEWYWQRLHTPSLKIHKEFKAFHEKTYGPDFHYQDFAPMFRCEFFDANQWADLFQQSGAKYIVLTSKHHEGYTLWPSAQAWNWNAMDVGPHRDLAGELGAAVKAKGLHMGYYYSLYEWYNPIYKESPAKYVDQTMIPQMKDLVTRYEPEVLWTDGDWDQSSKTWKSEEFLAWLYNESPVKDRIVVNDRWGNDTKGKHGTFLTSEYGKGSVEKGRPWEECRGIGESFGYNRNENLEDYQSTEKLIYELISVVSRGGNFLLNIGPTADGRIPVIMQQRLTDLGAWLKTNGEAIYGTQAWEKAPGKEVFYTRKGKDLYVLCTQWPEKLEIDGIGKPASVSLLGQAVKVAGKFSGGKLQVTPPVLSPGKAGAYAWVFKLENAL
ncbi:alpha-L-fucosidase [Siphonobacter aquaeclarae]|uniref:alpha-L-fucosidase n=1 Tax=Siphonobacter aquaeclarae TaxID=563176 RepID=A0A1G9N968_9BACT|nr:alpha-L-fucosidase [Siphonobacter aquaeclarae]